MDLPGLAAAHAVAVASSTLGALSGFGGGALVYPFLVPLVGVQGVVPVMTVAMVLGNLSRAWVFREAVQPRLIGRLTLGVMPGVVVGTAIYARLPPDAVALVIGLFMMASIPLRRILGRRGLQPGPLATPLIGFGFGVITGATPGAGVIMVAVLLGMGLAGPALIATDALVGLLVNILKSAMFGLFAVLDWQGALLGLTIGLAMAPGAFIGRWLLQRLSLRVHTALLEAMTVGIGLWFVAGALRPG